MGVLQETLPTAAVYTNPNLIISAVGGTLALGTTMTQVLEVVHSGEMGVWVKKGQPIERKGWEQLTEEQLAELGRYKTAPPGRYATVPFYTGIQKVNVRPRTNEADPFFIESHEEKLCAVHPSFDWYVRADGEYPYRALFNVKSERNNKDKEKDAQLEKRVMRICTEGLGIVLRNREFANLKSIEKKEVNESTEAECREELLEVGAALMAVRLNPITRAAAEVLKEGLEKSGNIASALATMATANALQDGDHKLATLLPLPTPSDAA